MLDELRSIQEEYFSLLERHLGPDLTEVEGLSPAEVLGYVDRRLTGDRLTTFYRGASVSAFEYRVLDFSESVHRFWQARRDRILNLIRSLEGNVIQISCGEFHDDVVRSLHRLLLYFDTVIVIDGLGVVGRHWDPEDRSMRPTYVSDFRRASRIWELRRLAATAGTQPWIVIAPSIRDGSDQRIDELRHRILGDWFGLETTYRDVLQLDVDSIEMHRLHERAMANATFAAMFDWHRGRVGGFIRRSLDSRGPAERVVASLDEFSPGEVVQALSYQVTRDLIEVEWQSATAASYGVDHGHSGVRWPIYSTYLGYAAEKDYRGCDIRPEEIVPMALTRETLDRLGDIDVDGLRKIRASEAVLRIRRLLHGEQRYLKSSSLEEFQSSASAAASRLLGAIEEVGTQLESVDVRRRRELAIAGGEFAAGVVLGVASIAVPVLAVPGAVLGALVGGGSVRQVVQAHITGKKRREEILERPLGILFQLMNREPLSSRGNSPPETLVRPPD